MIRRPPRLTPFPSPPLFRSPNQPGQDPPGLTRVIVESRQPLLLGTCDEQTKHGAIPIADPGQQADTKETYLGVPILLCDEIDRKSTRLNSSHANISYAVFCL